MAAHEKAAGQLVRTADDLYGSQNGSSAERQEESKAADTVQETARASVYGAGKAAQLGMRATKKGAESWRDRPQGKGAEGRPDKATPQQPDLLPKAKTYSNPSGMGHTRTSYAVPDRSTPEARGRELARTRAKQRTDRLREQAAAARVKESGLRSGPMPSGERPSQHGRAVRAKRPHKPPAPRLREVSAQAEKAAHTASVTAQRARMLAVRGKQAAQATARGLRAAGKKLAALFKAAAAAIKSLAAALAAGGTTAVLVVVFICLITMVAGSSFGIFFAAKPAGNGMALQAVVQQLTDDYYAQIREIEESIPHDRLEYAPDGLTAIRWEDVLSVFATDMAAAENGQPVAVLEIAQANRLKEILWEMNPVTYCTYTEQHEEERTTTDDEDNEVTETVTVTETVLEITILHSIPQDTASALGFTRRQNEQLALLADPQYTPLWMELLGGYVSGSGQILTPGVRPNGTGVFTWPLPVDGTITSPFGYREDPFTGEMSYHSGTDIAAPAGTPILAAADGTVTIANGTDSWGGGYGYYIKISHDAAYDTLYAHCSAICVTSGQTVRQGEVIGYVGSTGNSTGNHLHFEVWANGNRDDATRYFAWTNYPFS